MTIPELGDLEEVDLRQAWPHEARSFTPCFVLKCRGVSLIGGLLLPWSLGWGLAWGNLVAVFRGLPARDWVAKAGRFWNIQTGGLTIL